MSRDKFVGGTITAEMKTMLIELAEFYNNTMWAIVELAMKERIPKWHSAIPADRLEEIKKNIGVKNEN